MNIVIPMAGLGNRFTNCGFALPKPLIKIQEKPMYRHAVDCLPLKLASNVVFILRESECSDQIEQDIQQNYHHLPNCFIVKLDRATQGQAETILLARDYLNLNESTLIHNCDTYIEEKYKWSTLLEDDIDGAIVLFHSQEKRWSYARLDDNNKYVIEFKEKKVISSHASTGTYFFKNTADLLISIQYIVGENIRENNEFYLSSVYQLMLEMKMNIIPLWAERVLCFGTPYDLVESLNQMFLKRGSA